MGNTGSQLAKCGERSNQAGAATITATQAKSSTAAPRRQMPAHPPCHRRRKGKRAQSPMVEDEHPEQPARRVGHDVGNGGIARGQELLQCFHAG